MVSISNFMNYIDQFIFEQNQRNYLSGYQKNIALEYINNYAYMFDTYDNDEVDQALIKITDIIRQGSIELAREIFDRLSDKIKEGNNPQKRQNVWNALLALSIDLDETEE